MSPREGKNKILRIDGPLVRVRPASVLTRRLYTVVDKISRIFSHLVQLLYLAKLAASVEG